MRRRYMTGGIFHLHMCKNKKAVGLMAQLSAG